MAKRVFLGDDGLLAAAIAAKLLKCAPAGKLPDLSNIILTLPGKLARKKVLHHLGQLAPSGVLLPQLLTPALLLRYGMDDYRPLPAAADELIWIKTVKSALRRRREFDLLFPDSEVPPEPVHAAGKLRDFRNEVMRGGKSLAELEPFAGERGRQFAKIEQLYVQELAHAGYVDPLEIDRQAVENTQLANIPGAKIILAGVPDLPNMLKAKLANIDQLAPDMIEIWIHAPESAADDYDQWGIPIPEKWADKALLFPEESCLVALDPAHAAAIAAQQAAKMTANQRDFDTSRCAIVLSDPGMSPEFQQEFAAFTAPDGKPLSVCDPAGVPMSRLRLCRLGQKLTAFLRHSNDFAGAAELLRDHDYLLRYGAGSRNIIQALDGFFARFVPDELDRAVMLADTRNLAVPGYSALREALHDLTHWRQRFAELSVPEFLREFYHAVYAPAAIDAETVCGVTFQSECQCFRNMLETLDQLPADLIATGTKSQVLEIFFRLCGAESAPAVTGEFSFALEGCLEIPFLDAEQVIFCGMNEKFFPDRLDVTPYLTDSIRRSAGLRSNRDTAARAGCHLHSLLACRAAGNVKFIVLRNDKENNSLRPSRLLFAGKDLPDDVLVQRCRKLFTDPPLPPEKFFSGAKKEFRIAPRLDFKRDEKTGLPRLSPTYLDDYLLSPFQFFLNRVKNLPVNDYMLEEPHEGTAGTLYHAVFERLGLETFHSAQEYQQKLADLLEQVLNREFGPPPHPVLVRLLAENMRQRLKFAADVLYEEQTAGFLPVAVEYKFNQVEFAGAVFTGKVDRIEYNHTTNVLRILDFKTGKVDDVVRDHYEEKKSGAVFKKLQLLLYALLLRADPHFRADFPQCADAAIECGYFLLPKNVTETRIKIWEPASFNALLPAAADKTAEIIAEIKEFTGQVLHEDPENFLKSRKNPYKPYFGAGLRECVTGVQWQFDPPAVVPAAEIPDAPEKTAAAEAAAAGTGNAPVPVEIPPESGKTRCCDCPHAAGGKCSCCHGDCSDCKEFNGFKTFHIITAAAGTGKTHRLAARYIQLLSYGVDPAQIMAVTFTKKAAGEIFDKIIEQFLKFISGEYRCRQLTATDFTGFMRNLLNSEKDLQIGTIDSFFMQLVNTYAPELGVWGEVNILDQSDSRLLRKCFLQWVRSITSQEELDVLRELLKDANNSEDKTFAGSMLTLLKNVYPYYLLKIRRGEDGSMPQIKHSPWPARSADLISNAELPDISARLCGGADEMEAGAVKNRTNYESAAGQVRQLAEFLLETITGFGTVPPEIKKLWGKITKSSGANWCECDGELYFVKNSRSALSFPPALAELLRRTYRHIRVITYTRAYKKTAAVFQLMQKFDAIYAREVRSAGNLTFSDLPHLLCRSDATYRTILGPADRSLEARLDARIRHYMFDEFQDTSNIQWRAFDNLVGELFDGSYEDFRSFFCVGDIKQSIYQWRDGNPGLFRYLLAKAVPAAENAKLSAPHDTLYLSYRSCQPVLDMVNFTFGAMYTGSLPHFAEIQKWMKFTAHHSSNPEQEGFAALIGYKTDGDKTAGKARVIMEILKDIRPLSKGLTVAVLVQNNDTVESFAEELRSIARAENLDMPVSAEGRVRVSESMACSVFRAMLTLAAHPGDDMARELLEMVTFDLPENTPQALGMKQLAARMGYGETALDVAVAGEIFSAGIAAVAERFMASFGAEMTPFDRKRMAYAGAVAAKFTGSVDEFLEHLDNVKDSGTTLKQTVQVMTYHKSKGLGVDIVFMPDVGNHPGNPVSLLPDAQLTGMDHEYDAEKPTMPEPGWISYLPVKEICAGIPELARHIEMKEKFEAFEKSCALYVAMTRAKLALYVLVSPGKAPSTLAMDKLLTEQLAPHQKQAWRDHDWFNDLRSRAGAGAEMNLYYSCGRESWHGLIPAVDAVVTAEEFVPGKALFAPAENTRRASDEKKSGAILPEQRFAVSGGTAVGTLVHEMFEQLDRIDEAWDMEKFCGQFPDDPGFAGAAKAIFRAALGERSEIAAMLRNVPPDAEVWSEKRFLLKDPAGDLVPGAFDRVVIHRENGVPVQAEIYDWKSDDLDAPEKFDIYAGQLQSYRRSLAQLLDIPEHAVSTFVCALKLKKVIPMG